MARPLWTDAGSDPQAIAARLQELADTASDLRFEPRALPSGTDRRILHRAAVLRAKDQLKGAHGEGDRILSQEVRAIDDLVRAANLLMERLREWYALHAPEAVRAAPGKELASLVASHDRAGVLATLELTEATLGSDIADADASVLQGFAAALAAIHDSWDNLERRVQELMTETAPNLASVVGPVLGARLIAQAGSLERLAGFPTGTVQTLGAETALFRHIKEGSKPPKHGILFQHPRVHQAKPWQRGPIAKSLALQASLGAKADAFTGRDMQAELAERLEADLAHIAASKNNPPKRKPEGRFGRDGGGRGPPRQGGRPGGKPFQRDGRGPAPDNRGPPRSGGKPYGKAGGKPYGKPGGKPSDKRGPPKRKGPGAFRNQGNGPAKPPGGR